MDATQFQAGRDRLATPVLPLVKLIELLFLTSPFATVNEVVAELSEPIDSVVHYPEPRLALAPYLDLLGEFERLKASSPPSFTVLTADGEPLPLFEAVDAWVAQQVITRELEVINSLLCGPCRCTLCCTGPTAGMDQLFFEIPLQGEETGLFPLASLDTPQSRALTSASEPTFCPQEGRPFHDQGPGLYRWRSGWSLILPRNAACPHLAQEGACAIYPRRPQVCRRPQIFPYLLAADLEHPDPFGRETLIQRSTILAVWDCPYVQELQTEIAAYAQHCELEPVFKHNKA